MVPMQWSNADLVVEVFPNKRVGKIKPFSRSFLVRVGDEVVLIHGRNQEPLPATLSTATIDEGLIGHAIEWSNGPRLIFSRRYSPALQRMGQKLGIGNDA